jgi:UDP-N-acetylmuramyl-tripeptide synthetase
LTYGLTEAAKLRATDIRLGKDATQLVVETPQEKFPCRLPLIGRHNVYNALAAVGAGLLLKVGLPPIRAALNSMQPVPGRLEAITLGQPFGVFVDYAHTDDALRNVLTTLREITSGRLLLAFGCGGNRDAGKRQKMGRVAATLADFTIITNDNPRRESPEQIAAAMQEGFHAVRRDGLRLQLDRRRAIDEILRLANPGDTVLIAGKGHETYQEFEDTVVPFDDRIYASETLETLGWRSNG